MEKSAAGFAVKGVCDVCRAGTAGFRLLWSHD